MLFQLSRHSYVTACVLLCECLCTSEFHEISLGTKNWALPNTSSGCGTGKRLQNYINPLVTNGFSHPYHLDESTFILRGISDFSFLFLFSMKFMEAKGISTDGTILFAYVP